MKYNAYRDLSLEVGQDVIMVDDLKNNKMKRVEAKIVKKIITCDIQCWQELKLQS